MARKKATEPDSASTKKKSSGTKGKKKKSTVDTPEQAAARAEIREMQEKRSQSSRINDIIAGLIRLMPHMLIRIINVALAVIVILDLVISVISIQHFFTLPRTLQDLQGRSRKLSSRMGRHIADYVRKRLIRAYPKINSESETQTEGAPAVGSTKDALSLHMLFWMFLAGSIGGDVVEMIFMRITRGSWMSRSSLLWGWFSVVWGLAIVLFTLMLYHDRNRSDAYIFVVGTLFGGTYEYLCSVFTEFFFGTIFWDYSRLPFNIAGRVNLLYSF